MRVGRKAHVLGAGDTILVAPGRPHTFVNHTDEEAHFRTHFSPPMRLEALFTELAMNRDEPRVRQAARLMDEFPAEFFYLAYVPVVLQRAFGAIVRAFVPSARR